MYCTLYDGKQLVIINSFIDDITDKESIEQNDFIFFENMESYIDTHKFFSLTRYLFERLSTVKNYEDYI